MNQTKYFNHTVLFYVLLGILLGGCATTKPLEKHQTVFYPEPPAPPRIQFLRSFTSSKDIKEGVSGFDKFLVGEEKVGIELIKPYGVSTTPGKIYVCDSQRTVMIFDLEQKQFYRMEGTRGLGKVVQPMNISIDSEGNKFVSDPVRGEVLMYDSKDMFVKGFQSSVKWKPLDAEPFEGLLYVADSLNKKIIVFDIGTGNPVRELGQSSEDETENLAMPTNVSINKDGLLVISDAGRFQLVLYDRDGHLIRTIGKLGTNLGHFSRPRGVTVDRDGIIYAVDATFENVQIFREDGQMLLFFGESGNRPGNLYLPAGIHIDYDNISYFKEYIVPNFDVEYLVIVVSQFGQQLVNVYGFGKERGRDYMSEEELLEKAEETRQEYLKEQEKNK